MECYPDNPIYEEVLEEYEELERKLLPKAEPVAVFALGTLPESLKTEAYPAGTRVIYVLFTEGGAISACSTRMFQEGDYLKGMIADRMAGTYLFSLEHEVLKALKEFCAEHQAGIAARLEAPDDLPMEAQKIIYEQVGAEELDIRITSGFMYDPVKTSAQIYVLSEDEKTFLAQHDCSKCKAVNCKMRKKSGVSVTVQGKEKTSILTCLEGETILQALQREEMAFSAVCGGKGKCGKCKIRLLDGELPVTDSDREFFDAEALAAGLRLSCLAVPKGDCTISLDFSDETAFEVLADFAGGGSATAAESEHAYGIAIDIGTTTIALNLLGLKSGESRQVYTCINRQRRFGADVISRIQASNDGEKDALQQSIREDLLKGIQVLTEQSGVEKEKITQIAIGGNTTMGHLLMGYSCEGLGVYPFTPVNISTITGSFLEILGSDFLDSRVTLIPGISTYVGGDIVSGLLANGFAEDTSVNLLIDLGTNGEMAIGNKERIFVTSTAAGPAFEGGNIEYGMGSVPGAICNVTIQDGQAEVRTIGDAAPAGICGTGVVETVAELLKEELIDETGLLDEDYEDEFPLAKAADGTDILFTQKDIREIQLAKSAVRAGVETLMLRYGVTCDQVGCVYLAGGFGYKIDQNKAIAIGMLPEAFAGKIKTVGNSSLGGAVCCLKEAGALEKAEQIAEMAEEIPLSGDKDFNDFYMEYMMFE